MTGFGDWNEKKNKIKNELFQAFYKVIFPQNFSYQFFKHASYVC